MPRKRRSRTSDVSFDTTMPDIIRLEVEGDQMWDERENAAVHQAALDVGNAISRDIQRVSEQARRLQTMLNGAGQATEPRTPLEAADAFMKVYGRTVRFLRKDVPSGGTFWGETRSRDLVFVFSNAPHSVSGDVPATVGNRPEFSVHELGHVFENVIAAAIHTKKGRNSIPSSLANRKGGFFQRGRFQQSPQLTNGEIFADMFIGWVYDRWETVDGLPDSPLRPAGIARKKFMDGIMLELIETAMSFNNPAPA